MLPCCIVGHWSKPRCVAEKFSLCFWCFASLLLSVSFIHLRGCRGTLSNISWQVYSYFFFWLWNKQYLMKKKYWGWTILQPIVVFLFYLASFGSKPNLLYSMFDCSLCCIHKSVQSAFCPQNDILYHSGVHVQSLYLLLRPYVIFSV